MAYPDQEELQERRRNTVGATIKSISKNLQEIAAAEGNVKLPEDVFKTVFLPFFASDETNPYNVNWGNWETVAGGGAVGGRFKAVDVVDEAGNVLFTVPPMIDRDGVHPIANGANGTMNAIEHSRKLELLHPSQGEAYRREMFASKHQEMLNRITNENHRRVWNEIFIRYGREPLITEKNEEEEKASAPQTNLGNYEIEEL